MPVFLLTPAIKIAALVAIIVLIWGYGFKVGHDYVQTRWDATITEGAIRTMRVVEYRDRLKTRVVEKFIERERTRAETEAAILKEVPHAAQESGPFVLSDDAGRLWNDANRLPAAAPAAGGADDAARGATFTEALANHASFAGWCAAQTAKLTALQEWARGLAATDAGKEAPP